MAKYQIARRASRSWARAGRSAATPVVRADDAGLTRGDGCFEGCRLRDGVVDKLDAHLARMAPLGGALDIPLRRRRVARAGRRRPSRPGPAPGEAAVKLLLTRGRPAAPPTGFVTISPLPADYPRQRRDGLAVDHAAPRAGAGRLRRRALAARRRQDPVLRGEHGRAARGRAPRRRRRDVRQHRRRTCSRPRPGRSSGRAAARCTPRRPAPTGILGRHHPAAAVRARRGRGLADGAHAGRGRGPARRRRRVADQQRARPGRRRRARRHRRARGRPRSTPRSGGSPASEQLASAERRCRAPTRVVRWTYTREGVVQS